MNSALQNFHSNIERVRALGALHQYFSKVVTSPLLDFSDILRAQLVLSVSAFDYYIHEITRLGMLEVFNGLRPSTNGFKQFSIPLQAVLPSLSGSVGDGWIDELIRQKHSYLAFQNPDKVADAIRLFYSCDLWQSVSNQLGMSKKDVKARLQLIIDRRNKIAHEADLDPSYPDTRWPISPNDVNDAVDFLVKICEAVYLIVT
jgi:hypothetical protein